MLSVCLAVYCQTLLNRSSLPPKPPCFVLLFLGAAGAAGAGALLHPPKSSSGVMAGGAFGVAEKPEDPHGSAEIDVGFCVFDGILLAPVLDAGVLQTSEDPHGSIAGVEKDG